MTAPSTIPATNAVFGYPRWTELVTFSGGSWSTTYPVTNLGEMPLAKIARSSDCVVTSTKFQGVLSRSVPARLFALVRHSISVAGQYRLTLYSDDALANAVYSGSWTDVWPVAYDMDDVEWEDDYWWSGQYSSLERADRTWITPIWLDRAYSVRSFLLEISDPLNVNSVIDIGLFEVAQGWQVSVDIALPFDVGFEYRTLVEPTLGGSEVFEPRNKPRVNRGELAYLPRDEAFSKAFEMMAQHDLHVPLLFFPHPDEPKHWLRTTYLARINDPGLMSYANPMRNRVPISLKEII